MARPGACPDVERSGDRVPSEPPPVPRIVGGPGKKGARPESTHIVQGGHGVWWPSLNTAPRRRTWAGSGIPVNCLNAVGGVYRLRFYMQPVW